MLVLILRLLMIGDVLASRQASFIRISGGGGFWTVVQLQHATSCSCNGRAAEWVNVNEEDDGREGKGRCGLWWCAWWMVVRVLLSKTRKTNF